MYFYFVDLNPIEQDSSSSLIDLFKPTINYYMPICGFINPSIRYISNFNLEIPQIKDCTPNIYIKQEIITSFCEKKQLICYNNCSYILNITGLYINYSENSF